MSHTVLIADDHPVYREGVITALTTLPGFEVVGEASNGHEAVDLADQLRPDVVLMDLDMPVLDGVEATRQIVARHPQIAILVLTMMETDDKILAALRAGARGYLLKGADRVEITRAVESVAAGNLIFGAALASTLLQLFADRPRKGPFPELTEREREVLHLMARGLTNSAVASQLQVSDKTVRNYVSNIFSKLHVTTRAEAVAIARDAGIGRWNAAMPTNSGTP